MNKCISCGKVTANPKFCSRSCSASYNNTGKVRNGTPSVYSICLYCGDLFKRNADSKYCNRVCSSESVKKATLDKFLDGNLRDLRSSVIYDYLLERQSGVCQICSIEPVWNDKPLKFIRDHIDGNSSINHPDNIRLICHNCDSQLDTYKAKNKGNGRHSRRQRYAEGKSY